MYNIEPFMSTLRKQTPPPARKQESPKEPERPLIVQIAEWVARLSEEQRSASYTMDYFVNRFGRAANAIGPVLSDLGFRRERVYNKHRPHRRCWMFPA